MTDFVLGLTGHLTALGSVAVFSVCQPDVDRVDLEPTVH
jgi:hypothetical protein